MYRAARLRRLGAHFTLSAVLEADAGFYVCRVEAEQPVELRHRLIVLAPPTVSSDKY